MAWGHVEGLCKGGLPTMQMKPPTWVTWSHRIYYRTITEGRPRQYIRPASVLHNLHEVWNKDEQVLSWCTEYFIAWLSNRSWSRIPLIPSGMQTTLWYVWAFQELFISFDLSNQLHCNWLQYDHFHGMRGSEYWFTLIFMGSRIKLNHSCRRPDRTLHLFFTSQWSVDSRIIIQREQKLRPIVNIFEISGVHRRSDR